MRQAVAPGQIPPFFLKQKEMMLQKMQEMGCDFFAGQTLVEGQGICENNMDLALDQLNNPNYRNMLKIAPPQPV